MPAPPSPERQPLYKRLGWMILIWAVSVAALGVVAAILRAWLL